MAGNARKDDIDRNDALDPSLIVIFSRKRHGRVWPFSKKAGSAALY